MGWERMWKWERGLKSQIDKAAQEEAERAMDAGAGLKFQIENEVEDGMGRAGWRGEGGLKSKIENEEKDGMGRKARRGEGGLKSQIENVGEGTTGGEGVDAGKVD